MTNHQTPTRRRARIPNPLFLSFLLSFGENQVGFFFGPLFPLSRYLKESDNGKSQRDPSVLINLRALHPKPSFTSFKSDSVIRSASNSASRFVCSSAQQPQLNHEEKANEEKRTL
ncbi:hypothetical protein CRYUN_Cryun07bG0114900 [Craigia yunnanensis]